MSAPRSSNKSLQPTRDGAGSSAVAGGAFRSRVAKLWRSAAHHVSPLIVPPEVVWRALVL